MHFSPGQGRGKKNYFSPFCDKPSRGTRAEDKTRDRFDLWRWIMLDCLILPVINVETIRGIKNGCSKYEIYFDLFLFTPGETGRENRIKYQEQDTFILNNNFDLDFCRLLTDKLIRIPKLALQVVSRHLSNYIFSIPICIFRLTFNRAIFSKNHTFKRIHRVTNITDIGNVRLLGR